MSGIIYAVFTVGVLAAALALKYFQHRDIQKPNKDNNLDVLLKTTNNPQVRLIALKKLEDQELLEWVAINDNHSEVRCKAISKLNNPPLIKSIMVDEEDENVIKACRERLDEF